MEAIRNKFHIIIIIVWNVYLATKPAGIIFTTQIKEMPHFMGNLRNFTNKLLF